MPMPFLHNLASLPDYCVNPSAALFQKHRTEVTSWVCVRITHKSAFQPTVTHQDALKADGVKMLRNTLHKMSNEKDHNRKRKIWRAKIESLINLKPNLDWKKICFKNEIIFCPARKVILSQKFFNCKIIFEKEHLSDKKCFLKIRIPVSPSSHWQFFFLVI